MLTALNRYSDWGLLVLRIAVAAAFLYHGWQKVDAQFLNPAADATISPLFATLAVVEPIAGLMILFGLWTRLAALATSIIMLGAISAKMTGFWNAPLDFAGSYAPQGGTGWEFDFVLLGGSLVLLTIGAGKIALDCMIGKKM